MTTDKENNYWSTERVNKLLEDIDLRGLDPNKIDNPFYDGDLELKRGNLLWEFTKEEIIDIQKCAEDVIYFAQYCQVMTDTGLAKIELRDYQDSVLREYQSHRFNVFIAPRQVGKSIISAIMIVWYLLFNHDKNAMILANVGDTAEELMDKIKAIVRGLPFYLKPGLTVNNVMTMRFDNGCRVAAKTTTKTSGIGFTIHFLYMDEFAHISENFIEPFFRSTYPTVSSSKISRIIITSTPNGMNKFYEIYQGALEKKNSFNPIRVDWWQVPGRDEEWKKREIENLGSEELFNQEYGNQFISSSSLLLGSKELKMLRNEEVEYVWKEIDVLHDMGINYENLLWHPRFDLSLNGTDSQKFILSIDLASGGKGDFTVINIFKLVPLPKAIINEMEEFNDESDFFSLLQVGIFRDNEAKLETIQKIIQGLVLDIFNPEQIKIALEVNFRGELLIDRLLNTEGFYEELFIFTKHTEVAKKPKIGIKYNFSNKMKACEEIRSNIRQAKIIINDKKWTIPELFTFGLNSRGSYSGQSGHDDVAMSIVNLGFLFMGSDIHEMVGDIYDGLNETYKNIIEKKIIGEQGSNSNLYSGYSSRFVPKTKEGQTYQSFNDLI